MPETMLCVCAILIDPFANVNATKAWSNATSHQLQAIAPYAALRSAGAGSSAAQYAYELHFLER